MRPKPKLRQDIVGEKELGAAAIAELGGEVMIQGMPLYTRIELFSGGENDDDSVRKQKTMDALKRFVLEPDGSPLGWDDEDWNVFGGNHPDAYTALVRLIARTSDIDGEDAKKNEAQSEISP